MSFLNRIIKYFKNFPSIGVIILFCLVVTEIHLNLARFKKDDVVKWDIVGYYSYLPATFIEKDLKLNFINPQNEASLSWVKYGYLVDQKGNRYIKYPIGMSVLYSPFVFMAHVLANPLGFAQDGFSPIYLLFLEFSGLFYLLFGLLFLRKLLLRFYNEKIVAASLLLVLFGTNLFCYATIEPVMPHAYSFTLFSIFLYYTVEFYRTFSFKHAAILGVCFGLILLVRPVNVFFIIPFLLFGISNFSEIKERGLLLVKHLSKMLVFAGVALVLILPQFLYYKYVTGNLLLFSYGKERFYFDQPHIIDVLFSFRKGWFVYTPLMFFFVYGIFVKTKHRIDGFRFSLFVLFPVYLYFVSSWWCWWYGGSFGQRALIDIYPLLIFPLAGLVNKIQEYSLMRKRILYLLLTFCVILNLFQTIQYKYNIIDYDGMTFKEYVHVFGSLDDKRIDTTLLDRPDYAKAVLGLEE